MRRILSDILLTLMFLGGIGLIAYPTVSNWWNQKHQSRVIVNYENAVNDMDEAAKVKMWKKARRYNQKLSKYGALVSLSKSQKKQYNKLLDITNNGIMGYIEIPVINVSLPIYHGTDEAVLQTAIGHIEGSSLPVGGKSSHCVISGHRGLPSARLFTDLDKMVKGDLFYLQLLDHTLTYEVDSITVIEPTDLGRLRIYEGKDLCTLVTCTPYGINTHRLLVRGHRISNVTIDVPVEARQMNTTMVATVYSSIVLVIISIIMMIKRYYKRGRI